jgi:hypothetical protein
MPNGNSAGGESPDHGMPRSIATAIVNTVANDIACKAVIPNASGYNVAMRLAGFTRNKVNQSMEMTLAGLPDLLEGAKDLTNALSNPVGAITNKIMGVAPPPRQVPADLFREERQFWEKKGLAESCTEIANATFRAIEKHAGKGRMTWVTSAGPIDRYPTKGGPIAYHTATFVTVGDGRRYVFDWHATLLIGNPVIYRNTEDFVAGRDGRAALYSMFRGW